MKAYLLFITLLVFISCSSNRREGHPHNNEKRSEVRKMIIDCVSASNDISDALKNHIVELKKSEDQVLLNFNKVNLEQKDKDIIRECKKKVFRERRQRNNIEKQITK